MTCNDLFNLLNIPPRERSRILINTIYENDPRKVTRQALTMYKKNHTITASDLISILNYLNYKLFVSDCNEHVIINLTDEYNNSVK